MWSYERCVCLLCKRCGLKRFYEKELEEIEAICGDPCESSAGLVGLE